MRIETLVEDSFVHQVLTDSLVRIVSDVLFVGFVIIIASVLANFAWRRQQRGFFGLGRNGRTDVRVFVSSIFIQEGGTLGLNPVRRGFTGYAITEPEYEAANRLVAAIQTRPTSRILRVLVERLSEATPPTPVTAKIERSPAYVNPDGKTLSKPDDEMGALLADGRALVVIGSPLYNSAADYLERHAGRYTHATYFRPEDPGPDNIGYAIKVRPFGEDGREEPIYRHRVRAEKEVTDGWYREVGLVQKISDPDLWASTVFLCSGTSTASTEAAVDLLCDWRHLYREFNKSSFALVFEVIVKDREGATEGARRPKPSVLWKFRD